jgi:hypothetical protein
MSTGPRTPEGKSRSRANAIKHGLCATTIVPEDVQAMQGRASAVYWALKPQNEYQACMVDRVAIYMIRIERCERMERRSRDKFTLRAELNWDDDRRVEAEIVGGMLASRPAETVDTLRRTPHGCDWLMTRWAMLAHVADSKIWTDEHKTLAFDLMATPALFRDFGTLGTILDIDGRVIGEPEKPADMSRRMIDELKGRREVVAGLDEVDRTLAETDHDDDANPELRRLRRYESVLHGRLRWCVKQVTTSYPDRCHFPGLAPRWLPADLPTPKPEPRHPDEIAAGADWPDVFSPPFNLEPDEFPPIGERADIPLILKSRKAKRIAKAEARREEKRRQLDKLKA